MKLLLSVTFASIYALSMRLLFGFFDDMLHIMSVTFLILCPSIIGFLTVIFLPLEKISNRTAAFFVPWITSIVVLVITILIHMEGTICWLMIFPLFAILAGFGGIIGYEVKSRRVNNTTKGNTLNVSLAFLVPLFLGYLEGEKSLMPETITVTESVTINATTADIWEEIVRNKINKEPNPGTSMSEFMGFPRHVKTVLDTAAVGGKRIAYYERGLFFEETITQYEEEKKLVLEVTTYPDKIPPTVMDEHILIGGDHLDILEDTYELEKLSGGGAKLSLSSDFYINTPFNWYSKIWAKYLMSDILTGELERIKNDAKKG